MTIDIRTIPVLYINLSDETERNRDMDEMLSSLGFTNHRRFKAHEAQNGADGCYLSHINAMYSLYNDYSDEYVLVLEDDVILSDVDGLNAIINDARARYDFDIFSSYHKVPLNVDADIESVYCPPLKNTHSAYFMLYKRSSIPTAINDLTKRYVIAGALDIWNISGECRSCILYGKRWIRPILEYLPSRTGGAHDLHITIIDQRDGLSFYDITDRYSSTLRYGNEILHRIYTIDVDRKIIELTPSNRMRCIKVGTETDKRSPLMIILNDLKELCDRPNIRRILVHVGNETHTIRR